MYFDSINPEDEDFRCELGHRKRPGPCKVCLNIKTIVVSEGRNLDNAYPTMKYEWDYRKNYPLGPEDVTVNTKKIFHFKCHRCLDEFSMKISSWDFQRNRVEGCKKCRKEAWLIKEKILYPYLIFRRLTCTRKSFYKEILKFNQINKGLFDRYDRGEIIDPCPYGHSSVEGYGCAGGCNGLKYYQETYLKDNAHIIKTLEEEWHPKYNNGWSVYDWPPKNLFFITLYCRACSKKYQHTDTSLFWIDRCPSCSRLGGRILSKSSDYLIDIYYRIKRKNKSKARQGIREA